MTDDILPSTTLKRTDVTKPELLTVIRSLFARKIIYNPPAKDACRISEFIIFNLWQNRILHHPTNLMKSNRKSVSFRQIHRENQATIKSLEYAHNIEMN